MKKLKPQYVNLREIYNLGKITRSYISPFSGELKKNEVIEVLVSYQKITPSENSRFGLGEFVSFKNQQGQIHEYFDYHEIYSGTFSKWTMQDGRIERELRSRKGLKKRAINLAKLEEDITDKLKNLPIHVKDVFGL